MAESVKDGLDETVRRVKPKALEDISVGPSSHTNGSDGVSTSFVQYGAKFPKPQTDTLTESVQWKPESLSQFQLPVNSPSGDKGKLLDVVTVGKPEGDVTRTKPALIGDGNKFTPPYISGNVSASQERKPGDAQSSAFNRVHELSTSNKLYRQGVRSWPEPLVIRKFAGKFCDGNGAHSTPVSPSRSQRDGPGLPLAELRAPRGDGVVTARCGLTHQTPDSRF